MATATSINKVTITAPATSATLTIANGASLITSGAFSLTLVATATTVATLPAGTKTLVDTTVTALSSLVTIGTVTSGGLSTGAVIGGVTMTLGSDASYDMYYRNASAVLTRLANGTTGQVLTATTGAAPSWGTPAGVSKIGIAYTNVTVSNTTTETTLVSVSIPANTLGSANGVRARLVISAARTEGVSTCTIRVKYGSTTLTTTVADLGDVIMMGYIDVTLIATGATNTQEISTVVDLGTSSANSTLWRDVATGTAAEDSTGALNLVVTAQFSTADAADTMTMSHAVIERIAA